MCSDAGECFFQNFKPFGVSDLLGERIPVFSVGNVELIAARERSERAATLIWPSRTGHLYIAVPYSTFPGSRYFLL